MLNGFAMKSHAPFCIISTALSTVPSPVRTISGSRGSRLRTSSTSRAPSIRGMLRSVTTRSGDFSPSSPSASSPSAAVMTSCPARESTALTRVRSFSSSSTTITTAFAAMSIPSFITGIC